MNNTISLQLGDVQTTALIPVAIKASESLRKNPRVKDDVAVDIVRHLDVDTSKYDKFMSHEGVIARTVMLDRFISNFVALYPQAVVVNLGAGLDNRFPRVDNGRIHWFDVDFPDMIEARKKVFPPRPRVSLVASDVLKDDWIAPVLEKAQSIDDPDMLFLAEGLFMYLTLDEIGSLLNMLKSSFPHGTLIAEQNNPMLVKHQKHHDTVSETNAVFKSGTWSAKELEALCPGIRVTDEHSLNEEMAGHSLRGWLFAHLLPKMNDRLATIVW
ncbi:MAG: class I SAM-dependent methyltransferase [Bacteroidales bacterium]|nr:class I SAM-dependent methyltransferase [Bacteroidales bacterium]